MEIEHVGSLGILRESGAHADFNHISWDFRDQICLAVSIDSEYFVALRGDLSSDGYWAFDLIQYGPDGVTYVETIYDDVGRYFNSENYRMTSKAAYGVDDSFAVMMGNGCALLASFADTWMEDGGDLILTVVSAAGGTLRLERTVIPFIDPVTGHEGQQYNTITSLFVTRISETQAYVAFGGYDWDQEAYHRDRVITVEVAPEGATLVDSRFSDIVSPPQYDRASYGVAWRNGNVVSLVAELYSAQNDSGLAVRDYDMESLSFSWETIRPVDQDDPDEFSPLFWPGTAQRHSGGILYLSQSLPAWAGTRDTIAYIHYNPGIGVVSGPSTINDLGFQTITGANPNALQGSSWQDFPQSYFVVQDTDFNHHLVELTISNGIVVSNETLKLVGRTLGGQVALEGVDDYGESRPVMYLIGTDYLLASAQGHSENVDDGVTYNESEIFYMLFKRGGMNASAERKPVLWSPPQ